MFSGIFPICREKQGNDMNPFRGQGDIAHRKVLSGSSLSPYRFNYKGPGVKVCIRDGN